MGDTAVEKEIVSEIIAESSGEPMGFNRVNDPFEQFFLFWLGVKTQLFRILSSCFKVYTYI